MEAGVIRKRYAAGLPEEKILTGINCIFPDGNFIRLSMLLSEKTIGIN